MKEGLVAGKLIACEIGLEVPKAETWRCLLYHWCAALNGYFAWEKQIDEEDNYDDLPHWHNERAQVGFLAAAVWRMGGVALEEYRTNRKLDKDPEATIKDTTPGRCDLYFSVEDLAIVAEAKLDWMTLDYASNKDRVINKIEAAYKQLRSLNKDDRAGCDGLAMCWGVATKSKAKGCKDKDRENKDREDEVDLEQFAKDLKRPDRVIGVYYMPSKPRAKTEDDYGDPGESYPGVILVGEYHEFDEESDL